MKLISSYPRSGSAKLRFIIANLLDPKINHDFNTVSKLVPSIDNPLTRSNAVASTPFIVTHNPIDSDIYLYRHVGDCLVSEYWFKKRFYEVKESLGRYIYSSNYGELWRRSVEAGRAAKDKISFAQLDNAEMLMEVLQWHNLDDVQEAIDKASFDYMATVENDKGFWYLPDKKEDIPYMRSGANGQWRSLKEAKKLCRENESELQWLKLSKYNETTGHYEDGPAA